MSHEDRRPAGDHAHCAKAGEGDSIRCAPENVYVELAAPNKYRLRQEVNVSMIWCGAPVR